MRLPNAEVNNIFEVTNPVKVLYASFTRLQADIN